MERRRARARTPSLAAAVASLAAALAVALAGCPSTPYPEAKVELAAPVAAARARPPPQETLRFSVAAMLSPQETFSGYSRLLERLGTTLGVKVELVQRRTYAEVNELLAAGKVDAALLCTGGYLELEQHNPGATEVLAVPVIRGESTYHSYLIARAGSGIRSLADLEGKRFAYTDELSLSGRQYVVHLLQKEGRDPASFFGAVQFTGSHDRSVDAVARGVVDGAAVDSLIFDALVAARPELASQVRIVHRSPKFGTPPVVASTHLPPARRVQLRTALLALVSDEEAAIALHQVGFDSFAMPAPHLYESAAAVVRSAR